LSSRNWRAISSQNKIDAFLCASPIINLKYNNNQDNHNKKINEIKNMSFKKWALTKEACCVGMSSLVSARFLMCLGGKNEA